MFQFFSFPYWINFYYRLLFEKAWILKVKSFVTMIKCKIEINKTIVSVRTNNGLKIYNLRKNHINFLIPYSIVHYRFINFNFMR